jgi:hypothetical protein
MALPVSWQCLPVHVEHGYTWRVKEYVENLIRECQRQWRIHRVTAFFDHAKPENVAIVETAKAHKY